MAVKCCWLAREQSNGWKLYYCQDNRKDVCLENFVFKDIEHLNQALKSNIVFVEMAKKNNGKVSRRTQVIMTEHRLTPSKIKSMKDSELLSLRNLGIVTLNEMRNCFG